ncbi:MAG: hypothetical protein HY820_41025 [Acidobacteria bacterium]|nr:hypothetical protein [Acidobacteriota bacterium]
MRWLGTIIFGLAVQTVAVQAATLEKLSLDDMIQKSTEIVRGKVVVQPATVRGTVVYTRHQVTVAESYKGATTAGSSLEVYTPGGKSGTLVQRFAGAPKLVENQEYVLFLWTSRSGLRQIIGLSQGLFDLQKNPQGEPYVKRDAASEPMQDSSGKVVEDAPVSMRLSDMVDRIRRTLAGARH